MAFLTKAPLGAANATTHTFEVRQVPRALYQTLHTPHRQQQHYYHQHRVRCCQAASTSTAAGITDVAASQQLLVADEELQQHLTVSSTMEQPDPNAVIWQRLSFSHRSVSCM